MILRIANSRAAKLSALAVTILALSGFAFHQFAVPSVQSHTEALFRDFDELQRLGAYVVGADGEKLGDISKGYQTDSLGNLSGAGSEYKSNGLFNRYGKYGSQYSSTSAFNSSASEPPTIVVKRDGDVYSIGILTTSKYARTKGQRINPYLLKAWLLDK